jgi:nucleoside diphosphate kinase
MERTLSIIKPDGVSGGLIGKVIKRFEGARFRIAAMKMICLSKKEAEGFYAVHRERPFFQSLTDFMSSATGSLWEPQTIKKQSLGLLGLILPQTLKKT